MTVVEIVERERARLRTNHIVAGAALAAVVTVLALGADAAVVTWAVRRVRLELARASVAATIEREQELRAGALRGVLEVGQRSAIARRADRALVDRLSGRGPTLAPETHRASRRRAA